MGDAGAVRCEAVRGSVRLGHWAAAVLVVLAGAVTLVTLYWPQRDPHIRPPDTMALLLVVAMVLPLMWWRSRPLPAAMVSVGGALMAGAMQYPNNAGYYCAIASMAAAIYQSRRRTAWVFAGTAFLATVAISVAIGLRDRSGYTAFDFVLQTSVILTPLILVELLRTRAAGADQDGGRADQGRPFR